LHVHSFAPLSRIIFQHRRFFAVIEPDSAGITRVARCQVIHQVQSCVDELTEGLGVANAVDGEVEITWIFNGFGLEVIVSQEGKRFLLEEKNPSAEELLA
jgi:hypothetical protein